MRTASPRRSSTRRQGFSVGCGEKVHERPEEFLDRRTLDTDGIDGAARDFLAGMTDRFAVSLFASLFIPTPWVARG